MSSPTDEAAEPDVEALDQQCMPCRGTGQVISGLGGVQSSVACPWCEGSGERRSGIDAQAAWPPVPPAAPTATAPNGAVSSPDGSGESADGPPDADPPLGADEASV